MKANFLYKNTPFLGVSTVSLWTKAGARFAPKHKEGLPHLLEHLFKYPFGKIEERNRFFSVLKSAGMVYTARTYRDFVHYLIYCLPGDEVKSLDTLLYLFKSIDFTEESLGIEKKIIKDEIKRAKESPYHLLINRAFKNLWKGTDLAKDILGEEDVIGSISIREIRDFYTEYYLPSNLLIVITSPSDLDISVFHEIVEKRFGNKASKEDKIPSGEVASSKELIDIDLNFYSSLRKKRSNEMVHVSFAYKFPRISYEERILVGFLKTYFCSVFNGRLSQEMRFKNLFTYMIKGNVFYTWDAGAIMFYYTTTIDKLEKSLEIIKNEITKIDVEELKEYEKEFLINLRISLTNIYFLSSFYGRQFALYRRAKDYKDVEEIIRKVDKKKIEEVVKKCFSSKPIVTVL